MSSTVAFLRPEQMDEVPKATGRRAKAVIRPVPKPVAPAPVDAAPVEPVIATPVPNRDERTANDAVTDDAVTDDAAEEHASGGIGGDATPSQPFARQRRFPKGRTLASLGLFALVVLAPTAGMLGYSLTTASPVYGSEVSFSLRSRDGGAEGLGGGLAAAFGLGSPNSDDLFAIRSHLRSIETLAALDERTGFLDHVRSPGLDRLMRLPANATPDAELERFRDFVEVDVAAGEQLVTIRTRAFEPAFAQEMAESLLGVSEGFVNALNERARSDGVALAEKDLAAARQEVADTRLAVTLWRNENGQIDPSKAIDAQLAIIAALEGELAGVRAEITSLEASRNAPRLEAVRLRERSLARQVERERERISGDNTRMAALVSDFERLVIDRDLAEETYSGAIETLKVARQRARGQEKYVVVTSAPPLREERVFPMPLFHTMLTFLAACGVFLALSFARSLSRDYRNAS